MNRCVDVEIRVGEEVKFSYYHDGSTVSSGLSVMVLLGTEVAATKS